MSIAHIRSLLTVAVVLVAFSTQITDRTTGQPMPGLTVRVDGPSQARGVTNKHGVASFRALKPGDYAVRIESDDVPPQTVDVTLKATKTDVPIKVCSMTLDYHCATGPSGGGGG